MKCCLDPISTDFGFQVFPCSLPCRQSWVNIAFTLQSLSLSSSNTLRGGFQLCFATLTPEEQLFWRQPLSPAPVYPLQPALGSLRAHSAGMLSACGLDVGSVPLCCRLRTAWDVLSQAQCHAEQKLLGIWVKLSNSQA